MVCCVLDPLAGEIVRNGPGLSACVTLSVTVVIERVLTLLEFLSVVGDAVMPVMRLVVLPYGIGRMGMAQSLYNHISADRTGLGIGLRGSDTWYMDVLRVSYVTSVCGTDVPVTGSILLPHSREIVLHGSDVTAITISITVVIEHVLALLKFLSVVGDAVMPVMRLVVLPYGIGRMGMAQSLYNHISADRTGLGIGLRGSDTWYMLVQ